MLARFWVFVCACLALAFPLGARAETVTIVLTSWTTIEDQHLAPHAASHPAKGDFIDFRDLLVNRGRSQFGRPPDRAVAWDEGLVQYTGKTTSTMKVLVTFPGLGTMLYEGPQVQQANGDTVLPIVRGTGAFKGVKGTVTIGPGANTAPNTFRITVPGDGINLGSGAPVA